MINTKTCINAHKNGTHLRRPHQLPFRGPHHTLQRFESTHVDTWNPPAEYTAAKLNPTTVPDTNATNAAIA